MKIAVLARIGLGILLAAFISVAALAEDLGWADPGAIKSILNQKGYGDVRVMSGTKERQTDPNDGPGWYIVAQCVKANKDYVAVLWVNERWSKGRVISFREI